MLQDTSKRTAIQWAEGLLTLFIGLVIAHLGVTLFLIAELGSDTFTIFIQGLAKTCGISIGTCHVIILILLMVLMLIFTKGYVKPGTVICAFCGGWIIDFFLFLFGEDVLASSSMGVRFVVMFLGCVVLSFGMSIVIQSNSGTGPNDLVAIILTDTINKRHKVQFKWVRITCDLIFTVTGLFMGGIFGIGTLTAALVTGPLVQRFLPVSKRIIQRCFPSL
ncbi:MULTISPECIES: YczE/YyaS/YitT family protein [Lachnospiraceae]|jgi:uncharacterized membrane protein YczE|uniref:YitT family protein n=1 Tax=Faecalicatena acetigenes TaxID=2981790 RepID=A0ABT2TD76_9FIRM|nr:MULTISPECIES: membrane protein [Lachnospiraceae]MCU6748240.1 hypothetical protein [Faecalicatena acetigenes]RGT70915.1 hypothetical protein DWX08_14065 [Ruminococcus sp. AF18-22]SCI33195.1 Uncharacterized BCR%2C YitT family COG1284 [uncultured Clostridium sp.]